MNNTSLEKVLTKKREKDEKKQIKVSITINNGAFTLGLGYNVLRYDNAE